MRSHPHDNGIKQSEEVFAGCFGKCDGDGKAKRGQTRMMNAYINGGVAGVRATFGANLGSMVCE